MDVYREQHWGWLRQLPDDSVSDSDLHDDDSSLQNALVNVRTTKPFPRPHRDKADHARVAEPWTRQPLGSSGYSTDTIAMLTCARGQARTAPRE